MKIPGQNPKPARKDIHINAKYKCLAFYFTNSQKVKHYIRILSAKTTRMGVDIRFPHLNQAPSSCV